MMDLDPADTETLILVRESYDEDNDPTGQEEYPLTGCRVVLRLPQPDQRVTGERVISTLDCRHPDRTVDIRATDRFRRDGEDPAKRPAWTVEGEPARSPFPDGGTVFVLTREAG